MNPDGSLTFTPNANFTGPVDFTYTIADGKGGTDTATVTLNVQPINDLPEGADVEKTVSEDQAYVTQPDDFGFTDVGHRRHPGRCAHRHPADQRPACCWAAWRWLAGQVVSRAADIAAGKLQYVPDAGRKRLALRQLQLLGAGQRTAPSTPRRTHSRVNVHAAGRHPRGRRRQAR